MLHAFDEVSRVQIFRTETREIIIWPVQQELRQANPVL
jgi:virulence-associated protein VagC